MRLPTSRRTPGRPKRNPRLILLAAISIPSLGLIFKGPIFDGPPPPVFRLDFAKMSLERAADAGALTYAPNEYRSAEKLIQMGWMEMARQNGQIPLLRSYRRADSLLVAASNSAENGTQIAQDSLASLQARAQRECSGLQEELKTWREALDGSFIIYTAERFYTDAEMKLKQAKSLAQAQEYPGAHDAVVLGRKALDRLGSILAEAAEDEAAGLRMWRSWVENTLSSSRATGSYAFVVDKAAHKTYVVRAGRIVRTFNCELGYNSARPKLFAGDGATPEGVYRITKVKPGNSKYYKALLLDYPNDTDRRRFAENKRKGIISRYAGIGKLIEIHGNGGTGRDWTDGCVALANNDLDDLLSFAGVGTPVVIVRRYDGWK